MIAKVYKILEEKNEIDDHLLDIIGNEFKFDHQKGLSEWIKNSVAAYIRSDIPTKEQTIILKFTDSNNGNATIECIDFVGMTSDQITKAFKIWGDPKAALFGYNKNKRVPGGHGNGGKFYMRQMFKESYFITFKDNKLNIYGFSPNRKYGFANEFKDKVMKPESALTVGSIDKIVPENIGTKILAGKTGFTLVRGISPSGMINKIQVSRIIEKLRDYPQIRKHLERIKILVIHNDKLITDQLLPNKFVPKIGFEQEFVFEIPETLSYLENGEKQSVVMNNSKYARGKLVLKTSEEALERGGKFGELNRIDVSVEGDPVASYLMYELGVQLYPQSVFIYGDCDCPILEDPEDDCVKNDRSKLIAENPKTKALLQWIGEKVNELSEKILEEEKKEQQKIQKEHSRTYNDFLNKWSSRFLNRIRAEMLVGPGKGIGIGYGTGGTSGGPGDGKGHDGENGGSGKGNNEGGGDKPKRQPRTPRILLSGIDVDPFSSTGEPLFLDPRQGIVYQRIQDANEGIYWINTASPLAKAIWDKFSEKSQQWRSYLFQRHVDILIKEELRNLFKRDTEQFNPDSIDAEIFGRFMLRIQEDAAKGLESFLLAENYDPD